MSGVTPNKVKVLTSAVDNVFGIVPDSWNSALVCSSSGSDNFSSTADDVNCYAITFKYN